jgi:hypothetical protein
MENATHSPLITASVEIKDSPKRYYYYLAQINSNICRSHII